jgi:hypothetical protein
MATWCEPEQNLHETKDSKKGGPVIVVADMKFWRPFTMTRVEIKDQTDKRIRDNWIISNELNEHEMSISHEKTRFKNDSVLNEEIYADGTEESYKFFCQMHRRSEDFLDKYLTAVFLYCQNLKVLFNFDLTS